jgi:Amt family ammonium transporter
MGLVPGTPEANAMAPLIENSKGWLENLGFVDFAGSTVVHSLGGWIALAALIIIGPRRGRFKKDGTIGKINASNVPAAVLGVLILWFGWFGFNGGSTLGWTDAVPGILIRTTIAAAAGMVVTLAVGWPLTKVPDVNFVINGALAGLVAITAPVAVVDTWDSIIIGGVGGLVMLFANWLMEKQKIDDAVGAIPVHMAAGVWGTLSVAFFGETGKPWLEQLWVQALGIVSIGGFAFWGSLLFLWVFNKIKPLRVTEEQELQGLNVAEHGASTELMDLTFVMEEQAKSEDLSLRAPEDPFTEVGQIGQEYNRVIGHLQDNLVAKSEYINILDNVSDGLFLLDVKGNIGPYYSSALEEIIGFENLAGESLEKILFPLVMTDVLDSIKDFITLMFNHNLDFSTVNRLNPLGSVELFLDAGNGEIRSKFARFQFKRILDCGRVVRLMVILKDISKEVELEKRMKETQSEKENEMALFYRLIHLDPELLQEYVDGLEEKLERMNSVLQSGQNAPKEVLRQLMKLAHSIKGESSFFEMQLITDQASTFEEDAAKLLKKENLENKDFIGLTLLLGDLHKTVQRMTNLLHKLSNFQAHFVQRNLEESQHFSKGLTDFAKKVAKEQSKLVDMVVDTSMIPSIDPEKLSKLKDILIQLTRNAVVHGIEGPKDRLGQGKKQNGRIEVKGEVRDDGVVVTFRDDGQGFPVEKLRAQALKQGLSEQEVRTWKKSDVIQYAFSNGSSTADKVTEHAGRGVGMALVKDLAKEIRGKLMVNFKPKEFTQIRIFIPNEKMN